MSKAVSKFISRRHVAFVLFPIALVLSASLFPRWRSAAQSQAAPAVRADLWITNGPVFAMKRVGDTLYAGGQFDHVGPATGPFGVTDPTTGVLEQGWPRINGVVKAVASDGAGGWYVGGKFDSVGGTAIHNLAHIKADKTLDTQWIPNPSHAQLDDVRDVEVANGTVYVCGAFTEIGGRSRRNLAALDAATGAATGWNPNPSGAVFEIEIVGDRIYVGGAITAVGTTPRGGLAAFSLPTGALIDWQPALTWNGQNIESGVHAIESAGGVVFAGGVFTGAGSANAARGGLAAFDATTGALLPWNPNPQSTGTFAAVYALEADGSTLYVGGRFAEIGGSAVRNLAALDAATGQATQWGPNPTVNDGEFVDWRGPFVSDLVVTGNAVYAAGGFKRIGNEARRGVAAVDKLTGAALPFRADASDVVHAVALDSSDKLAAGGDFRSLGGVRRRNLAAIDLLTGRATDWNPDAEITTGLSSVKALAAGTSSIYVSGNFDRIGGRQRKNLAEVSLTSGAATDWAYPSSVPPTNVSDMELTPTRLYLAGGFTIFSGTTQLKNLVSLSRSTGALLTDFAPQPDAGVADIEIAGQTMYVGGSFRQIGGQARAHVAALDLAAHALKDWKVQFGDHNHTSVSSLAVADGRVFIGGRFFEIVETGAPGTEPVVHQRGHLVAVDAATARLDLDFHPRPNFHVERVKVYGATCYVAGPFWELNGQAQFGAAALHARTGGLADWRLMSRGEYGDSSKLVVDFIEHGQHVYVGGLLRNLLGSGHSYLAGVTKPVLTNVAPTVGLTIDVNGAVSVAPANVAAGVGQAVKLTASPADVDGSVARVDFYAGATLLASDAAAPYELTKSDFAAGEHLVKAVATDDRGGAGESVPIRLTVLEASQGLSVAGRVVDQDGQPLAGVSVALGGARSAAALTDAEGRYSFANLAPRAAYSVALALDGYYFHPEGIQYPSLGGNETADFVAYRQVSSGEYTSNLWVPNGAVRASAVRDGVLYIGGDFTALRGIGEHGASISTVTGAVDQRFGKLNGKIYAAAADGAGGWFVGGTFTAARTQTAAGTVEVGRMNLAHLLADGSLDENWNPGANGKVSALALVGETLYVGGSFTEVGGEPRAGLAAIDKTTGATESWDAKLALKANRAYQPVAVHALVRDGEGKLFVGGLFDTSGGIERASVAQFDISGETPALTEWGVPAGNFSGPVRALALSNASRTLYLGGLLFFTGDKSGTLMSAVDADTGARRTNFQPPKPGGEITALTVRQNTLFVVGEFTGFHLADESVIWRRGGLASLDATTGAITDWHPQLGPSGRGAAALVLHVSGSTLYVGGNFTEAGGTESSPATPATPRRGLAAYDAATGALTNWNPLTGGAVGAIAQAGTTLFVGSGPTTEGVERKHLAALDVNTGQPTEWNPQASGRVVDLALGDTTIFAAGEFDTVGGSQHKNVAEIGLATGRPTEWNPGAYLDALVDERGGAFDPQPRYYKVTDLAVAPDRVFLGGAFSSLSTAPALARPALVAVSRATGQPLGWDANFAAGSDVRELVTDGATLYVGGKFTSVGGQARSNLAALGVADAQPLAWSPNVAGDAEARVESLAVAGASLYVGGAFAQVGAQPRSNLAEVSLETGLPTAWAADVRASVAGDAAAVKSLAVVGSLVYAGGHFDAVGAAERRNLAAVSRVTAQATNWNPQVAGGDVLSVTTSTFGGKIFAGGAFTSALGLGSNRAHLIGVLNPDPLSLNKAPDIRLDLSGIIQSGRQQELKQSADSAGGAPHAAAISSASSDTQLHTVQLNAEAFDGDGQVARVEFYRDGVLLASDSARPFTHQLENLPAGTHTFTARAFDNLGVPATSEPLTVTVGSNTYSIEGRIAADGSPLAGVAVMLTGAQAAATTTDADGRYSFGGLAAGAAYAVKPLKAGYGFSPAEQTISSLTSDRRLDFAASSGGATAGSIVISEFRLRGPARDDARGVGGAADEFVELYNNSKSSITVGSVDGSPGWSLAALNPADSSVSAFATIPNGTVIPSRAHYLVTNADGYSLAAYAAGDLSYAGDLPDDSGLALFATANPANFNAATRLDAAGFASPAAVAADLFREGGGLSAAVKADGQHSFVRRLSTGAHADSNDNAADFMLVSTGDGSLGGAPWRLGAPGPENLASPLLHGAKIKAALLAPDQPSSAAPNLVRDLAPVTNGQLGTLSIRRRFTNNTGQAVTALRFRVVDLTTAGGPATASQADLRLLSAPDVLITLPDGAAGELLGVKLELGEAQPSGGGLNSTAAVATITPATPLAPGASVSVQFLLGVERSGPHRFFINVEALPGSGDTYIPAGKSLGGGTRKGLEK